MLECVLEYLKAQDVEYKENVKLGGISPIRIGGYAKIVILPRSIDELVNLLRFCGRKGLKVKIIGSMSNILVDDMGYDGILVKTDKLRGLEVIGNNFVAECGVSLYRLAGISSKCGFSGFEELSGIPGRVGGAVYMNAGAYGREISDLVTECIVYDIESSNVTCLKSADLAFSYRESSLRHNNFLLLSASFRLFNSSCEVVLNRMKECRQKRIASQPTNMPSLGSVFKRPDTHTSAGELIDKCGLRGFLIGGAAISEKHAGFIVNLGGATSGEVKALAALAERSVYEKYGIRLQREIEFLDIR